MSSIGIYVCTSNRLTVFSVHTILNLNITTNWLLRRVWFARLWIHWIEFNRGYAIFTLCSYWSIGDSVTYFNFFVISSAVIVVTVNRDRCFTINFVTYLNVRRLTIGSFGWTRIYCFRICSLAYCHY